MAASGEPSPPSFPLGALLKRLSEERPDRRFLSDVLDHLAEALDCERIFLFRLRAHGGFHVLVARSRDREDILRASQRMSHYAVRRMVKAGVPVFVPDARQDRRYRPEEALEGKRMAMSILVLPLRHRGEIQGGIYADHRFRPIEPRASGDEVLEAGTAILVLALSLRDESRAARRLRRALESLRAGVHAEAAGLEEDAVAASLHAALPDGANRLASFYGLITANPDLSDICDTVRTLSSDLPILIQGETGTGKGLLARAVHESSARGAKPFVVLHAPTVPDSLIESELLGHVKGAFTGAESDHDGVLVRADGGTLFLDEAGDMSAELQKKLLRVLEDGQVRAVGGKEPRRVDVRLITSTSRDLEALVREGLFRQDLYFRLKGLTFLVPALRERREDVLPLAEHFLGRHAAPLGRQPPVLEEGARRRLANHSWPGNVRELENEMRRLVALGRESIEARDLELAQVRPREEEARARSAAGVSRRLGETVELAEREAILEALRAARGNKSRAALNLGVTRKSLYRRMAKYGISGRVS